MQHDKLLLTLLAREILRYLKRLSEFETMFYSALNLNCFCFCLNVLMPVVLFKNWCLTSTKKTLASKDADTSFIADFICIIYKSIHLFCVTDLDLFSKVPVTLQCENCAYEIWAD